MSTQVHAINYFNFWKDSGVEKAEAERERREKKTRELAQERQERVDFQVDFRNYQSTWSITHHPYCDFTHYNGIINQRADNDEGSLGVDETDQLLQVCDLIGVSGECQSCLGHEQLPFEFAPAHRLLQSIQLARLPNPHSIYNKPASQTTQYARKQHEKAKSWLSPCALNCQFGLSLLLIFYIFLEFRDVDSRLVLLGYTRFGDSWIGWSMP